MNQSEQINELMGALAKAQGQMSHAKKDSSNPHFRSAYADLASVWQACREALSTNGLSVVQNPEVINEKQVLITILGHSSGQWIKSMIVLPIQKPGPQELGSCLSYCRRYALASMVGVYQDDDDAETAQKPFREPPRAAITSRMSEAQCDELSEWVKAFPESKEGLLKKFDVTSLDDIPATHFTYIVKTFKQKQQAKDAVKNES